MSFCTAPGSAGLMRIIQPSPNGAWLTSAGLSASAVFTSTTSPATGANRSLTVLTASTTPNGFMLSSLRPTSGSSTNTTSPSCSVA